ncbi:MULTISPECIES: hypothetical protein [unclassified Streptomyces]|uniref:hypothetical protein n=1 Tax=unclassified Streptomyces TaxID=2593676 RepID=UPI002E1624FF|nr:hypothetical protein OG457_08250 [Streptomyces sp. NBC_01207]WTA17217.1 hypothetical protein OG365_03680 [Streptomyces sp. NBC_00853]
MPIAALVERLEEFVAAGDTRGAGRELAEVAEVARSRPAWWGPQRSAFIEAVARFRSVPELADVHQRWSGAVHVETATRRDAAPQLVATPPSRSRPHGSRLEETVLVKVIAADRPWSDALELIGLLQEPRETAPMTSTRSASG